MPKVTHESCWSEILEIYQAGNYESNAHLNAEAALKVKIAKSTIENQEAILGSSEEHAAYSRAYVEKPERNAHSYLDISIRHNFSISGNRCQYMDCLQGSRRCYRTG